LGSTWSEPKDLGGTKRCDNLIAMLQGARTPTVV